MSKIRIAFFGASRALEICRKAGLFHHPDAEVVAVCDGYAPVVERFRRGAEEAGAGSGIVYMSDPEHLLDVPSDAVVLCNYATEHAPWAIRCLKAGRNVLSELLPMQALSEAVELVEAVEQSGLVYNYAENYCFMEHVLEMRRLYESGEMGSVMAAEAVFINDLSHNWPRLTHGNPKSWRNYAPSTFYCTHAIGPLMFVTGQRAVRVNGMEIPTHPTLRSMGARAGSAAIELMQLSGGGMAKSLHGNLKRPYSPHYSIFCENGSMETDKYDFARLHVAREYPFERRNMYGDYAHETYYAKPLTARTDLPEELGHSIYYMMECFLGSIRGREECRRYAIDVYQAMDMVLPGFLAYRSILSGGEPFAVPDFRIPEQREPYRHDTACTDPKVAGDRLLPVKSGEPTAVPEDAYARCREMFEKGYGTFW